MRKQCIEVVILYLIVLTVARKDKGKDGSDGRGKEKRSGVDVACVDIAPPWSSYDCETQAEFGKCERDWMRGYCLKSCAKCDDIQGEVSEQDDPSVIKCPKSCNNKPPKSSTVSCETHKTSGECNASWMKGSCQCTCNTCKALQKVLEQERKSTAKDKKKASKRMDNISNKDKRPDALNKEISKRVKKKDAVGSKKRRELESSSEKNGHLRFTILHFNDFHSRVEQVDNYFGECTADEASAGRCHGGVARMKTVIDAERKAAAERGESVLLLNSGDDFAGTKWDYHYKGEAVAHFLNQLGIDAMTLGNHEFDYGPDVLANYVQSLNYSVVSANIKANDHWIGSLVQPYVIKEVDGVKVGICGTTTQVTMQWAKPWPVQFDDSTWKARECVEALQSQGIKIIILLSHEGLNADRFLGRKIPGIDLIIGGHSHAFLYPGDEPPAVSHLSDWTLRDVKWDGYPAVVDSMVEPARKIYVLQAGWGSRYIGRFSVEFDEDGEIVDYNGWPILLGGASSDNPVSEDKSWKQDVARWRWW